MSNDQFDSMIGAGEWSLAVDTITVSVFEVSKKMTAFVGNNPFSSIDINAQKLYLYFYLYTPKRPDIEALERLKTKTEQVYLTDKVLYFYSPEGMGRSKLASKIDKILGIKTTTRNLRTIRKLREMLPRYDG